MQPLTSHHSVWYLSLPPTSRDLTQGQWPEGRLKVGMRAGGCRARAGARALLDYASHRPTSCNVSLMSQTSHGPNSGSWHVCLVIVWTEQRGPVSKVSMLQFAHPKVAPPKMGAFRPRVCHWYSIPVRHKCQTAQQKPGKYWHTSVSKNLCSTAWPNKKIVRQ